jgi:hypothetical protein
MLHELFLFIGLSTCYASCLATVGVGGFIAFAVILPVADVHAWYIFQFLHLIGNAGVSWSSYRTVFKICTDLCTDIDFTEPRDEDQRSQ